MSLESSTRQDGPYRLKDRRPKREIVKRFCLPAIKDLPRRGGDPDDPRASWILWYSYPAELAARLDGRLDKSTLLERLEFRERMVFEYAHNTGLWQSGGSTRQAMLADGGPTANYKCPDCGGRLVGTDEPETFRCDSCGTLVSERGGRP